VSFADAAEIAILIVRSDNGTVGQPTNERRPDARHDARRSARSPRHADGTTARAARDDADALLLLLVLLRREVVRAATSSDEQGSLPMRPLLAPWLRRAREGGRVLLGYGHTLVSLDGAAVHALVPRLLRLLDGTRSVEAVVAELGERARPAVVRAIGALVEAGVVVEGPSTASPAALVHAARSRVAPRESADRIADAAVAVVGSSDAAELLPRLLFQSGVVSVDCASWSATPAVDLAVVAPAPFELPLLRAWNRRMLETDTPWLLVLPYDGRFASLGPLVLPGDTACHECLRRRRLANEDDREARALLDSWPAPFPQPPALAAALAGLAATLAVAWVATRDPSLPGALFVLELDEGVSVTRHHVHRVPRCAACSPSTRLPAPMPWAEEAAA
jgi:bacteriocin biosynthesis cyclodehydratase domain-containing protein